MNVTLIKALAALAPAYLLLCGSFVLLVRQKTVCLLLQLIGAASLVVVGLCHVFEALHLFRSMGWGLQHSVGHYLDLFGAVLGLTLFPIGYLWHALAGQASP